MIEVRDALFSPQVLAIVDQAIEHYGSPAQMAKTREECFELIEALDNLKQKRDATTLDAAIDETADVLFTALQMAKILGSEDVAERIMFKAKRLEKRILDTNAKPCSQ